MTRLTAFAAAALLAAACLAPAQPPSPRPFWVCVSNEAGPGKSLAARCGGAGRQIHGGL